MLSLRNLQHIFMLSLKKSAADFVVLNIFCFYQVGTVNWTVQMFYSNIDISGVFSLTHLYSRRKHFKLERFLNLLMHLNKSK